MSRTASGLKCSVALVWRTCFRHGSSADRSQATTITMGRPELTRPMSATDKEGSIGDAVGDVAKPSNGELRIGNRQWPVWGQSKKSSKRDRFSLFQ